MNKFYKLVITAVFLLFFFLSRAQTIFTSILTNPSGFTLDDARFWQGGVSPPNPCNLCDITIWAPVTVAHNGMSTDPANNFPPLDHVILSNSTLRIQPSADVSIDTYVSLTNNTKVFVGTDPAYAVTLFVNDQVDMDATSSIRIGNTNCVINANNDIGNTPIKGPYPDFANGGVPDAGIYSIANIGGQPYSLVLNTNGNGSAAHGFAFYQINCGSPSRCTFGLVYGPAVTGPDPAGQDGIIFQVATTLPVQLVQFTASKTNDGSVLLNWATSQEVNAGYYDVERSGDRSGWIKMGSVKAKGNSSTTTNYNYTDRAPIDGPGYYRLKMVDLDGKFTYSKIVSTTTAEDNPLPLVIYSNPFSDLIRLKVNVARAQNLTMTVSDIVGKTFISKSYQAQAGDNYVNLQPNTGGSGIYILHINGESYNQTVKLEKQ